MYIFFLVIKGDSYAYTQNSYSKVKQSLQHYKTGSLNFNVDSPAETEHIICEDFEDENVNSPVIRKCNFLSGHYYSYNIIHTTRYLYRNYKAPPVSPSGLSRIYIFQRVLKI